MNTKLSVKVMELVLVFETYRINIIPHTPAQTHTHSTLRHQNPVPYTSDHPTTIAHIHTPTISNTATINTQHTNSDTQQLPEYPPHTQQQPVLLIPHTQAHRHSAACTHLPSTRPTTTPHQIQEISR